MANRSEITKACQKLRRILEKTTQAEVGRRVGKDQRSVSRWALGLSRPDPVTQLRLKIVFEIDPLEWLTKRELRALKVAA